MGAAWFLARADGRGRWVGALVLALLVAVAGGAALASAAGARRSATALTRFERASHTATLEYSIAPPTPQQLRELRAVPNVVTVGHLRQLAFFNVAAGFLPTAGPVDDTWGRNVDRGRIVAGRHARAADELEIGEGLADRMHLHVGDRLTFRSFTPEDVLTAQTGFDPTGPDLTFRIVGFVRRPLDLGARGKTGGVIVTTRAFVKEHEGRIGSFIDVLRVVTRHGDADAGPVTAAARRIFGDDENFSVEGLGTEGEGAESAITLTSKALWALAGVVAAAGVVALALTWARRMVDEAQDHETVRALGLSRAQQWAALVIPVVPVALVGAVAAVGVAYALSPVFPIGVARDAEPTPGFHFDVPALTIGFVAVIVTALVVGALAAAYVTFRRSATAARPSRFAGSLARAGSPAPVIVGVGFAISRPRGRNAPRWPAIVTVALGVLAVVAAFGFRNSLDRLASSPARYGWTWSLVLDGYGTEPCPRHDALARDPALSDVGVFCFSPVSAHGRPIVASTIRNVRGSIEPTIIDGRAPRTPDEVAVGRDLLRFANRGVGDPLTLRVGSRSRTYRVVGTVVIPSLGSAGTLAGSAYLTLDGLRALGPIDNQYFIVRVRDGVDPQAVYAHLTRVTGGLPPSQPSVPAEIERIRQIDSLPALVAGITIAIALIAVAYTLVVSVRRRRRDLAILKTVGFTRGQTRGAVAVQATTIAAIAIALGALLGLVVGDQVWRLVADELGVGRSSAVPLLALVVVVPVAVLVVNLIAAVPARAAARTVPAAVLRSE